MRNIGEFREKFASVLPNLPRDLLIPAGGPIAQGLPLPNLRVNGIGLAGLAIQPLIAEQLVRLRICDLEIEKVRQDGGVGRNAINAHHNPEEESTLSVFEDPQSRDCPCVYGLEGSNGRRRFQTASRNGRRDGAVSTSIPWPC